MIKGYNYILIAVIANISKLISQSTYCYNASSCVGDRIITPDGYWAYIYGYKALYGPTTSINGTGDDVILYCYGSFACYDISFIHWSNKIDCWGSNACSNITDIYLSATPNTDYIWCAASNSCKYSNLVGNYYPGQNHKIWCAGDRSCNYAYFEGITRYDADSAYVFYGAVYNSSGLPDATINLWSYYAGFGGTIVCYPETSCTINCYGNACYMLYVQCIGGNNCQINQGSNDSILPITNAADYNLSALSTLSYNSAEITRTNDAICNGQINVFDNIQERKHGAALVITIDNTGPICCRAQRSCQNITNIQFNTTILDTSNHVICSGERACQYSNINNINGDVSCEGYKSCASAIMSAKNVYCLGARSCYERAIYNAQNVYCSGYESCDAGTISSSGNINIYLLGFSAGFNSTIFCNANDHCFILCGGRNACSSITFYCIGNCTTECVPDSGCPEPTANHTINPTKYPTFQPTSGSTNTVTPVESNPTNKSNKYGLVMFITTLVLFMFILSSYIYSKCIRLNDFYRIGAIMTTSFHIIDVLSDIFFSINMSNIAILWISIFFVIAPILLTLYQLHRAVNKWKRNEILSLWLSDNIQFLYVISVLTGSSFAAVHFCTSHAFNLSQTDMPLNKTQLLKFQTKRMYSTVLAENIPQLGLQIFVLLSYGGATDIIYISMTCSILSIIISILSMVSARNIIRSRGYCNIQFDVTGGVVVNNMNECRNLVKKLQIQTTSLLGINKNLIEIMRATQIKKGLRVSINIFVNNATAIDMNIEKEINDSHKSGELAEMMKMSWNLSSVPIISNIKYEKYESKERRDNKVVIKASSEPVKNTTIMMSRIISDTEDDMKKISLHEQSLPPKIPPPVTRTAGSLEHSENENSDDISNDGENEYDIVQTTGECTTRNDKQNEYDVVKTVNETYGNENVDIVNQINTIQ